MISTTQFVPPPTGKAALPERCDDETAITEITLLPDGRLCLFGASRQVLELLADLHLGDESLHLRLAALRYAEARPAEHQESINP